MKKRQQKLPLTGGATTTKPVPPQVQVFNAVSQHLSYLEERWADESMYEDWADYEKSAKDAVEKSGGTFLSLSESPFQLRFKVGTRDVFTIWVTDRHVRLLPLPTRPMPHDGVMINGGGR